MIKNIILDFGDVLINLDKSATPKAMAQYGFTELTPALENLFNTYEKGLMSSPEFLKETGAKFPTASEEDLIKAWNAILLDFPEERLTYLEELAKTNTYRLFLLSNTNEIHIDYAIASMGADRFNRFKNCFEVFYLSYEMGMRKPDAEIFEYVLEQNDLIPSETLFVDDTKENTDTAAQLGINVWNLQVGQEDFTSLKNHL